MNKQSLMLILAFMVAFLAAFSATPTAIKIAHKIGAVDIPKDNRRMHKKPIPRLGGIAIVFGFLVSVICFSTLEWQHIGILLGAIIIVILGILDDCHPLPALLKFGVQIAAACIPVLFGVKIDFFNIFSFLGTEYWVLGGLAVPITIFWIVALTNAVNLIDGLDGLAAGVATISSICLFIISMMNAATPITVSIFCACLAGGCFGFLPYNFNPARIFMGDSGSTFLGYMLACISVEGMFKGYAVISFALPFIVLALPLLDTTTAIVRRLIHHKPIMQPDRGHLHHKLIDSGFSQKQAVLILYAISAVMGGFAIALFGLGILRAILLLMAAVAFFLLWFLFLQRSNDEHEQTEQQDNQKEE